MQDIEDLVTDLSQYTFTSKKDYDKAMLKVRRKYKLQPKKSEINAVYKNLVKKGVINYNPELEQLSIAKSVRSESGVLVIALFTSAYPGPEGERFDCKYDCHYCPSQPGQPRSYLDTEPGVMRAIECGYDCITQFDSRLDQLVRCGHIPDKLEILVLGGTWSSYPQEYRDQFILDIYYAANTYGRKGERRDRMTLNEEKYSNQKGDKCRIIGITLETRPDCVSPSEIVKFREYGCTRVQLGVQHTDDEILRKINRRCYLRHTKRAIRMLKECGFKIDIHLMPDLPGSSIKKDREMFEMVLNDEDLQVDQWKVYPTSVTPYTKIKEWYENGEYKPYAESDFEGFFELLIWMKSQVHYRIRLMRVIRDIPERSIIGGNKISHLRDVLKIEMKKRGLICKCIRCREVKDPLAINDIDNAVLYIDEYRASNGTEYYLSFENKERSVLYGQLRLRFNDNIDKNIFPELKGSALIRELHVYGRVIKVGEKSSKVQHTGFGKKMLKEAEKIVKRHGVNKIAVISGEGVKDYYVKFGYKDEGYYMTKILFKSWIEEYFFSFCVFMMIVETFYELILNMI